MSSSHVRMKEIICHNSWPEFHLGLECPGRIESPKPNSRTRTSLQCADTVSILPAREVTLYQDTYILRAPEQS